METQDERNWELESSSSSRRSHDSSATLLFHGSSVEREDEGLKGSETLFRHGEGGNEALDQQGIIDPQLKDYPIPLVAQTVHLRNDDTSVF
jgi:hypothetical protein